MKKLRSLALSAFVLIAFSCQTTDSQSASRLLDLKSPFYSTVPNLSIYNSHVIARDDQGKAKIIRGMRPKISKTGDKDQFAELANIGVTDVLVLKDNMVRGKTSKGDVELEKEQLEKHGIRVVHLPIPWQGYTDFKSLCGKSVKIFRIFDEILKDPSRKLFMHCTVGEDRTGFLAGIYKNFYEKIAIQKAFHKHMCRYGYADGNPVKPKEAVVDKIHLGLTPIYLELSKALADEKTFDATVCEELPDSNPMDYWTSRPELKEEYSCETSDLYAKEIR